MPTLSLAESIPPSCRKVFAACGLTDAIDGAGFYRSAGNTVWWGSDEPRRELFAGGARGYQVERARFDRLLQREAIAAGADVREALVRDVDGERSETRVRLETGEDLRARFVLDCSGRAGIVARRGWRTAIADHPRTIALVGVWRGAHGSSGEDPTHTLVESHADGWAWSVPRSPDVRYVTAMVDPQRTELARGRPASEVYCIEIAKARHLSALLRTATLDRPPWGCDASIYSARTFAADSMLLVGDAASFVDPLSSYGIKKALASAWLASVAVHTALRTPAMTRIALEFFAARERAMAASLLQQSRALFGDAASTHAHPFWSDRAAGVDLPDAAEVDTRALREDPRVQQAFAWLKAQDGLALRPSPAVRRQPSPVIRGHEIVLEDRLIVDGWPGGLRFLRDVDLAGILALAPEQDAVPAFFESYNRRYSPVALPDFLGALSVAVAFGLLEDQRAGRE